MNRVARCVISVVLLLVLGLALSSLALGAGFDPPGHYDGDDDDAGLIWKTLTQCADVPVTGSRLTFIPSASTDCPAPRVSPGPRHVAREPLGSRAPPVRHSPLAS
jgi:hypothetical protein